MPGKRLLWQIFPSYLLITIVSLVAVTWYAAAAIKTFHHEQAKADLAARAQLMRDEVAARLAAGDNAGIDALCKRQGKRTSMRVTVVTADGTVVGETTDLPSHLDNHKDREEIAEALEGRPGSVTRLSNTLGDRLLYVAIPVREGGKDEGRVLGAVRTSVPLTDVDQAARAITVRIFLGGLLVAAAAAGTSLWLSRRVSRPLEVLRRGAERFARGDFDRKLPLSDTQEIGALAEALNLMAARLDDRIRALVRQRNEVDAVLSGMVEGVFAVDCEERIISMNQACARMLDCDAHKALGRSLPEVVRNADLQRLVLQALSEQSPANAELKLQQRESRLLEAHATVLRDAGDQQIGILIVLHDLTRLRKLETIRRDFVANVSHELRTPITSIQGFVETLLDGHAHSAEDSKRFLEIVAAQTSRLGAIIEDLLTLSRIEQEDEAAQVVLEQGAIRPVLESAIGICRHKADEKQIAVEIECDSQLKAEINAPLLEQAVVNLIDNAIKYTPNSHGIFVSAKDTGEEVVICVRDTGCGIPKEHLSRIFERFYRVDKARSRKLGGTGLGLAIVKHITEAHHGRAEVESTVGLGSTFSLHLPLPPAVRQ